MRFLWAGSWRTLCAATTSCSAGNLPAITGNVAHTVRRYGVGRPITFLFVYSGAKTDTNGTEWEPSFHFRAVLRL